MRERGWCAERAADADLFNLWDHEEDDMARGRTTRAREKRALARKPPARKTPRRREHVPAGGGVFFRAGERTASVDPELIRDVFRKTLSGTALGRALGY